MADVFLYWFLANSPSEMAHSLARLADEVLSEIFGLQSDMLVSLWLCGSTALHMKMVRCCKSFRAPLEMEHAYQWPRMLSNLTALTSVDFCCLSMREPLESVSKELQKLPKTLKSLRIGFAGAGFLFYTKIIHDSFSGDLIPPPYSTTSPQVRIWDIGAHFPVLERLEIGPNSYSSMLANVHGPELLLLPNTLHTLDFNCLLLYGGDFSTLPRGLRSLSILRSNPCPLRLEQLPPGLTHLKGLEFKNAEQLMTLPRSLKSDIVVKDTTFQIKSSVCSALPPELTSLRISETDELVWRNSFPTFTCLTSLDTPHHWSIESISLLPRTVTCLQSFKGLMLLRELRSLDEDERQAVWPPLRKIECQSLRLGAEFLLPQDMAFLPRTLTDVRKLDFGYRQDSVFKMASDMPSCLTAMSVYKYTRVLPRLSSLFGAQTDGTANFSPLVEDIPDPVATPLPSSLKCLHILSRIGNATFTRTELRAIPEGMTELRLRSFDCLSICELPRSLTLLSIENLEGVVSEDNFGAFPPGLTSLSITLANFETLIPTAFSRLPLSLVSLKLHLNSITGLILTQIPTTIRHLSSQIDSASFAFDRLSASPNVPQGPTQPTNSAVGQEDGVNATIEEIRKIPARWLKWALKHPGCEYSLQIKLRSILYPSSRLQVPSDGV